MRGKILTAAVAAFALMAGAANAKVFDFYFYNDTDYGSGTFDVAGSVVQAITGQVDGMLITGLSPYAGSDQQLSTSGPFVDFSGISFSTALDSYNLFAYPGPMLLKASIDPVGYPSNGSAITLSVTAVPEPAVWGLMVIGVAMVGASMRYGRKRALARAEA